MITVKGSSWKKEDYRFMADVIAIGMSEACIDYERNCSKCPSRLSCEELLKAKDFCEKKGYWKD